MSDVLYRQFIQTLPSALDGKFAEWVCELGEWRNPACHVRRAGRSGVAFKEEYACIPMTNAQHAYQHQVGELACLRKFTRDPQLMCALDNAAPVDAERIAGDWFDAQVEKYREMWRALTGEAPWEAELVGQA